MNMSFGDYSRYCGCLLRYDSYTNDFGERCCKECRKPRQPIIPYHEMVKQWQTPLSEEISKTPAPPSAPNAEKQPDIHIHIHIHGESNKDTNEIAKVVSDQLSKQFKSAGVILK